MDRIQRNGETWQRQSTGEWLKFDVASGQWLAAGSPPPPPPPPPAGAGGPYVALEKASGRGISLGGLRETAAGLDRRLALVGGAALLAVLFLAGGFAAFGGNESGVDLAAAAVPAPEREPMSKKQQFIHDADALCVDVMKAAQKLPTPTTLTEATQVLEQARAIVSNAIERGQRIKAPRAAQKGWKDFVGDRRDLEVFDKMMAAAVRGDIATVQAIEADMNREAARERKWAKRYGMNVCSQELS